MNNSDFFKNIEAGCDSYGIILKDNSFDLFFKYYLLLLEWNKKMNLVSSKDMDRFVFYHVLDSLKTASVFDFNTIKNIMDFGSGAGLPGIPLLIAFQHLSLTLIDSRNKRCEFLSEASKHLGLSFNVLCSKAENLSSSYNNAFDNVISRATLKLPDLFSVCERFVSCNGSLISIKGDNIDNELSCFYKSAFKQVINIFIFKPVFFENVRTGNVAVIKKYSS